MSREIVAISSHCRLHLTAAMASQAAARPLTHVVASIGLGQGALRSFSTAQRQSPSILQLSQPFRAAKIATLPAVTLNRQQLRRGYADQIPVPTEKQVKKRGWGFLKWTWRITYVSVIGGLAWTAYNIYHDRNPEVQHDPDPNKKTLVVLGVLFFHPISYTTY